jgi:hypothetical protein
MLDISMVPLLWYDVAMSTVADAMVHTNGTAAVVVVVVVVTAVL